MLISATDRVELLRHVQDAEAFGRADHPLVQLLRRIAGPADQEFIRFTILGEPASKANSRKLVKFGERMVSVKGDKALAYERDALRQIPPRCRVRIAGPVAVAMRIFYATERPDLDESLILDILQDRWSPEKKDKETGAVIRPRVLVQSGVYQNDRQVRDKHIGHGIDRANPRTEIVVVPMRTQFALELPPPKPVEVAPAPDKFAGVPF